MNEIAKQRIAERFDQAIDQENLTNVQVSEITGLKYPYIAKARKNDSGCPQWVMHYLQQWTNTGEKITSAKWDRLAAGYPKVETPTPIEKAMKQMQDLKEVEKFDKLHKQDMDQEEENHIDDLLELNEDDHITTSKQQREELARAAFPEGEQPTIISRELEEKIQQTLKLFKQAIEIWET